MVPYIVWYLMHNKNYVLYVPLVLQGEHELFSQKARTCILSLHPTQSASRWLRCMKTKLILSPPSIMMCYPGIGPWSSTSFIALGLDPKDLITSQSDASRTFFGCKKHNWMNRKTIKW
uniref:Uncharacterized protein n=1 Tax=Cacopsylla melanoneura TaxID=428564 RepID=A0A8D8Z1Y3_9HEMI